MKTKLKTLLTQPKAAWKRFTEFWIDLFGYFRSFFLFLFSPIIKPAAFYGFKNINFAKKYARRRNRRWGHKRDQLGKQQGIFPFDDIRLLVCSPMEMKWYQKHDMVRTELNYTKLFKREAYWYITTTGRIVDNTK